MASIQSAMEEAYGEFLAKHKEVPSTRITLIQFDSQNDQSVQYLNVPIAAAEPLNLQPRGSTPLTDAFCKAIDNTGKRLADMTPASRPDQVLFVVITDGQENASKTYRRSDVQSRVTKQTNDYKWQFMYLGANQDAIREAQTYGIAQDWAMTYAASAGGASASMNAMIGNSVSYTSNSEGMRGTAVPTFTKVQRQKALDHDAKGQ